MTAYRFRVKFDPDPTALWRDVVVGADRTVAEFQSTVNAAMGLDEGHLWFVGADEDYWDSPVKYQCPEEYGDDAMPAMGTREETHDAGETTVGGMADRLGLAERDRICYLYDYGAEWRFYGILKEIDGDGPDDREAAVVDGTGDSIDQYDPGGPRGYDAG